MTALAAAFDNPAWGALTGLHADLGEQLGGAARYRDDVSPFHAVADPSDPASWRDLAGLIGPGGTATLVGVDVPPAGWTVEHAVRGVRLVAADVEGASDTEAVRLTAADVPEMLDLVERTRPGPFRTHTIDMGTYLGIRRHGRLLAMAGERLHPPGGTEISAVCTDPSQRGRGLAGRLVRAVVAGIVARGETPFLHAAAHNHNAIALYRRLGFGPPRPVSFTTVRAPGHPPALDDSPEHVPGRDA